MNYDYPQSDLSRSILSGLLAGIVGTIINLVFTFVYRSLTDTTTFNILDVSTTIFGTVILLLVCGVFFYFFVHYLKKGINLYRIIVFVVTAAIVFMALQFHRTPDYRISPEFRVLFIGTQVIIGGMAAFLIPYLFRHEKLIS
jgi:hypothetical protein